MSKVPICLHTATTLTTLALVKALPRKEIQTNGAQRVEPREPMRLERYQDIPKNDIGHVYTLKT